MACVTCKLYQWTTSIAVYAAHYQWNYVNFLDVYHVKILYKLDLMITSLTDYALSHKKLLLLIFFHSKMYAIRFQILLKLCQIFYLFSSFFVIEYLSLNLFLEFSIYIRNEAFYVLLLVARSCKLPNVFGKARNILDFLSSPSPEE